jgi:MGT family glycosyltransferase
MSSILFVTWNGGGNVRPVLATAADLCDRGHEVHVLSNPSMSARVEKTGASFSPFQRVPAHDPGSPETDVVRADEGRTIAETNDIIGQRLVFGRAAEVCADTLEAIDACSPDLVVADYVLVGAMVAARTRDRPLVVVSDFMYPLPYPGRPRQASTYAYLLDRMVRKGLPALNRLRSSHGLPDIASPGELFAEASLFLVMTYHVLGRFDLPERGIYAGQQLRLPAEVADPPAAHDDGPLVLVCFSSVFTDAQDQALTRLTECLGQLPVRALVGLGSAPFMESRLVPANVEMKRFIPLEQLLPDASLIISHAGAGTVSRALAYGVPQLCVPFIQDQYECAALATGLGVGLSLKKTATREEFDEAIRTLLGDPSYLARSRAVAREVYAEHEDQMAARAIESLLRRHG